MCLIAVSQCEKIQEPDEIAAIFHFPQTEMVTLAKATEVRVTGETFLKGSDLIFFSLDLPQHTCCMIDNNVCWLSFCLSGYFLQDTIDLSSLQFSL